MLLHLRRYLTPIIMQNDAIIWREKYNHPVGWDQHFSPLSLPEMFFQSADRDPDAVLLDFLGRRYSYAERSEEHTSELQSLMRISYAVFCLKKKKKNISTQQPNKKFIHTINHLT